MGWARFWRLGRRALGRSRPAGGRAACATHRSEVTPDCPPEFVYGFTTLDPGSPDCPALAWMNRTREPSDDLTKFKPPSPADRTMPRRLLRMVHELHRRGYEPIRLAPYIAYSSGNWQVCFTSAANISRDHGAQPQFTRPVACCYYCQGQGARCFDWMDAEEDTPEQLATKFLERLPDLAESGRGLDGAYARWYAEMLRATEPEGLIYAYGGPHRDLPEGRMPTLDCEAESVPLPPPGEAVGRPGSA